MHNTALLKHVVGGRTRSDRQKGVLKPEVEQTVRKPGVINFFILLRTHEIDATKGSDSAIQYCPW